MFNLIDNDTRIIIRTLAPAIYFTVWGCNRFKLHSLLMAYVMFNLIKSTIKLSKQTFQQLFPLF